LGLVLNRLYPISVFLVLEDVSLNNSVDSSKGVGPLQQKHV